MDFGLGDIVDDAPLDLPQAKVTIEWDAIAEGLNVALHVLAETITRTRAQRSFRARAHAQQLLAFGKGLDRVRRNLDALLAGFAGDVTRITADVNPRIPFRSDDGPHLLLQTPDVIVEHANHETRRTDIYNLGPYVILIPMVMTPRDPRVHWIPVRDPKTPTRHPHHHTYNQGEPATCLGTFANPMHTMWQHGRLVEYATLCTNFVHIYNQDSPLVGMGSITHKQLIASVRRPRRDLHRR